MRIAILIFSLFLSSAQTATAFTYQGQLSDNQNLAQGSYDFQFLLYDSDNNGAQVATTLNKPGLTLIDGVFTTELDFGANVFTGVDLWLEIQVKPAGGSFVNLAPRQKINAVPYAVMAQKVSADSISSAEIQDFSILAEDINPNEIQQRVIGTCGSGSAMSSIAVGGQVICSPFPDTVSFEKIAIVAQSGGNYSSINDAINNISSGDQWCSSPSQENPCTIQIMPGIYDLGSSNLVLDRAVNLKGSGIDSTIIRSSYIAQANGILFVEGDAKFAKISDLTLQWNGADALAQSDPMHIIYDETGAHYENIKLRVSQKPSIAEVALFSGASSNPVINNMYIIFDNSDVQKIDFTLLQLDTINSIKINQLYTNIQMVPSLQGSNLKGVSGTVNGDFMISDSKLELGIIINSSGSIYSVLAGIEINITNNVVDSKATVENTQITLRPGDTNNGTIFQVYTLNLNSQYMSINHSSFKAIANPNYPFSQVYSLNTLGYFANNIDINFSLFSIENTSGTVLGVFSTGNTKITHTTFSNSGNVTPFAAPNSINSCGFVLENLSALSSNCL